jgi:triphosphatase
MAKNKAFVPPVAAAEMRYALALVVAREDAARLRHSRLLQGGRLVQRRVISTYYDTPEGDLQNRMLALSVRRESGRVFEVLETVPTAAAGGGEQPRWQTPLARPAPDLKPLAKVDGIDHLADEPLKPVFTCRLRRSRTVLEPDGAAIAVSIDEGEIRARGGRKLPVSEIELELQQGTPRAVFKLANALADETSLHVELRSKAARGYALAERRATHDASSTPKFGRVELRRGMAAEDALALILGRCVAHALANEQAARAGKEEGVHQIRVALRRLRVALALFKSMLPESDRQWIIGEAKWLNGTLARARNWDIAVGTIERVRGGLMADRDLAALAHAAERERRRAYAALRSVLGARRYTQFVLGLLGMIETRAWRRPGALDTSILQVSVVGKLADDVLERRYRKASSRLHNFDRLGAVGRHRLRIALKKMRYAAEAFASIYPAKAVRRYSNRLATLQDGLGLLNDFASTERLLRTLSEQRPSPALVRATALVRGWSAHVALECEHEIQKGLKRLKRAEPFWRRAAKG